MKPKKSKSTSVSGNESEVKIPEVVSTGAEQEDEKDGTRVTIGYIVDASGKIQLDRMRGKTKEQLKELLENSDLQRELGISGSVRSSESAFNVGFCSQLYDGLGMIMSALGGKMGIDEESAELLKYNDTEKEMLAEPTAKILAKHSPEWINKVQDEIALCFLLSTITYSKFEKAKELAAFKRAKNVTQPVNVTEMPHANTEPRT